MLAKLVATGVNDRFYSLADYKEFFRQAALPLEVKRVNVSSGFKYFFNAVVNGLTHARYAFIGRKKNQPEPLYGAKPRGQPEFTAVRTRDQSHLRLRDR